MSPGALPSGGGGAWFSNWYVVSIDTGHIAQSPQSRRRWSPAFKMEPVLSVSSFKQTSLSLSLLSFSVFFFFFFFSFFSFSLQDLSSPTRD